MGDHGLLRPAFPGMVSLLLREEDFLTEGGEHFLRREVAAGPDGKPFGLGFTVRNATVHFIAYDNPFCTASDTKSSVAHHSPPSVCTMPRIPGTSLYRSFPGGGTPQNHCQETTSSNIISWQEILKLLQRYKIYLILSAYAAKIFMFFI